MADVAPVVFSPVQPPLPTPSPFTFSVASTAWSARPSFRLSNLFLRFLALLFSFISAISLSAPSSKSRRGGPPSSFGDYPELQYCFVVALLVSIYSAYQLFKGVCDIAYRGILISDRTSDYISFILDQFAGYLLVSSSSVSVVAIKEFDHSTSLGKVAIVSVTMSISAFVVTVACSVFSGYKLSKRI